MAVGVRKAEPIQIWARAPSRLLLIFFTDYSSSMDFLDRALLVAKDRVGLYIFRSIL